MNKKPTARFAGKSAKRAVGMNEMLRKTPQYTPSTSTTSNPTVKPLAVQAWLDEVPQRLRSGIVDRFLRHARRNRESPEKILACVRQDIENQRIDQERAAILLGVFDTNAPVLDELSKWSVAYVVSPASERRAVRKDRDRAFAMAAMERMAPTDRQLRYLAKLGDTMHAPITAADASRRIDAILNNNVLFQSEGRSRR